MSSSPFGFPLPPFSPRILHPSCLSSPREKLSLLLSLDVTVFSRSFPSLYVPSLPYFPYFLISCVSTTLSCLPSSSRRLEISTPLFREHIYTYNHFHLSKVPAFELSLSLVLLSVSPFDLTSLLLPSPAHFAPGRNNKRSTRGVTTPRLGRNRADLRPGSEKAIWANRTPPTEGGEGPVDNERPYGR